MSELKWYVLKSISGQENKVKNYIESEIKRLGFEQYVTQVVIPMEKVIQLRNGKKIPKERPYYPGYLMVEAELMGEIPHIIKNIPGVISFLSLTKGGDPVPMRKSEVKQVYTKFPEGILYVPFFLRCKGKSNFSVFVTTELSFPYLPSVRYT